jgi:hypothetical protein
MTSRKQESIPHHKLHSCHIQAWDPKLLYFNFIFEKPLIKAHAKP